MSGSIPPPNQQFPTQDWEHYELFVKVFESFAEIPQYFRSTITVSGIRATEIYAFSSVLGLTIEQEVIRTLNSLRNLWDTEQIYGDYLFVRQPQSFPDVLLKNPKSQHIIMGIELKSWYLLAKESEPSFRYQVTPNACATQDLLVIVPWVLSNVLSGSPIVFKPFIASARYVAEYRNYWWQYLRNAKSSTEIWSPEGVTPYPRARDKISDKPVSDSGKNFGRIARVGLIDDYVRSFESLELLGIEVWRWRRFLKEKGEEAPSFDASALDDDITN